MSAPPCRIVILRPQPGAEATAQRAREAGLDSIMAPLFAVVALPWSPPDPARLDAVMLTSANAARLGGEALARYHHLPVWCVGEATALAARTAGFAQIAVAGPDSAALVNAMAKGNVTRALHLSGRIVREPPATAIEIMRVPVYDSAPRTLDLPALVRPGDVLLLHSPRAAARMAQLVPHDARRHLSLIAISAGALAAAGTGWRNACVAAQPDDIAMLAMARRICQ